MVRLTRAQQQERTRAAVLTAARAEFASRGYAEAKIDRIAERAELTRGAVYSNFPGKRALYLAVLVDMVDRDTAERAESPGLGAFARVWLERIPLTGETSAGSHLQLRSLTGVVDERGRDVLAQSAKLEALLLALALEGSGNGRRVRLAELVLTTLNGAGHLAEVAPGFGDPFDVVRACEHLAALDLADTWDPPYLPFVKPAPACSASWTAPAGLVDLVTGDETESDVDGVIAVLGAGRLEAAEEAVRAARFGDQVTIVIVTDDPAETGRLVRLRISDVSTCLRRAFPAFGWPRLVLDSEGSLAAAVGVSEISDATEEAVRVLGGQIVARARGRGAAYAAAAAEVTR
jgi:AcrR family transcriptional regulator